MFFCEKVQEIAKKCAFLLKNARVAGDEGRVAGYRLPTGKHAGILTHFQTKVKRKMAKEAAFLVISESVFFVPTGRSSVGSSRASTHYLRHRGTSCSEFTGTLAVTGASTALLCISHQS